MRGRSIPISPARRLVIDFMRLSRDIPLVSVQRHMHLERLARARSERTERPMWMAIFTKAYGIVSREFPELRRAYVKMPWPRLYEYPQAIALLPVGADYCGEESVFPIRIRDPGAWRLADVDRRIVDAKAASVAQVEEFRRLLGFARLPLPIRYPLAWLALNIGRQRANYFGTFLIGGVSELGIESQHMLSPVSNSLSFGVISPDGHVDVRMYWDHRVMDGVVVGKALRQLERTLNGEIADELYDPSARCQKL
jgi:hypothetical protein